MKSYPRWLIGSMILGFALLDQISKWLLRGFLSPEQSIPIIPKIFQLTLAFNTGAAFSMLRHQPLLLTMLTAASFLLILAYCMLRSRYLRWEPFALSLILGGALGNLVDRILWGKVTDFLDVVIIRYPIFNIADSFIFCGVLLLLYAHLRPQAQPQPSPSAPRPVQTQPHEHV